MKSVLSWGRLSAETHQVKYINSPAELSGVLADRTQAAIAFGMGRSYGDVCLNLGGELWVTRGLDKFISFNQQTGQLVCEAGVLLGEIQRLAVPRGWMLPVSPGTQMVTLGGAIANDVHGKNHHAQGVFGDHVKNMTLLRSDGEYIRCGPDENTEWFRATVGGLGLTGIIVQAEIQLRKVEGPWLTAQTLPFEGLDEFFSLASDSEEGFEYTVSWIDCLSGQRVKGLFMRANHSHRQTSSSFGHRKLSVPFVPPLSLVNRFSLKVFNQLYFEINKRKSGTKTEYYEQFFYPLDHIRDWNKIYGPKGFFQYQCVVPFDDGRDAIGALLDETKASQEGSFLAVLKTFGDRNAPGMLSFARSGITLALDFPNKGEQTLRLFERFDDIVRAAHGRLYPAKDARMPRELFLGRLSECLRFSKISRPRDQFKSFSPIIGKLNED